MSEEDRLKEGVTRHLSGRVETYAPDDDVKDRRVKFQFADENPITMPWGDAEVYGHKKGEFDFSRLNGGAPFLRDHDNSIDAAIGVIEKAWVEGRKSYAIARLDTNEEATEYARKVENGILKDVSMGVRINAVEVVKTKDGARTYRITDWQPMEVSAVAVGRIQAAEVISLNSLTTGGNPMADEDKNATAADPVTVKQREVDMDKLREEAKTDANKAAQLRTAEVISMGKKFAYAGGEEVAMSVLSNGGGLEEFRAAMDPKLEEKLKEASSSEGQRKAIEKKTIGLSTKEVQNYSMVRFFNAVREDAPRAAREAAGLELEASEAARKLTQGDSDVKSVSPDVIPNDVLLAPIARTTGLSRHLIEQRAGAIRQFATGNTDDATALVETVLQSGSYIDILRAMSIILGRAMPLMGLVGNVDIPRLKTSVNPSWKATAVQPRGTRTDAEKLEFELVEARPKKLFVETVLGLTQMIQSTPDIEMITRFDQAYQHGLKIDSGAFVGAGGTEPDGIVLSGDVNKIAPVDGDANGWTPGEGTQEGLRKALWRMRTAVAKANGLMPDAAFIMNPDVVELAGNTPSGAATGSEGFVYDQRAPNNRPVIGFPVIEGTQVPSNRTMGTGTDLSAILFGSLSTVIYAQWGGGLDVLTDPYSLRNEGGVLISTICHADIQMRQPKMLAVIDGVKTAA